MKIQDNTANTNGIDVGAGNMCYYKGTLYLMMARAISDGEDTNNAVGVLAGHTTFIAAAEKVCPVAAIVVIERKGR